VTTNALILRNIKPEMNKMRPFYFRRTTRARYSNKHEAKGYEIRRTVLLPTFLRKY